MPHLRSSPDDLNSRPVVIPLVHFLAVPRPLWRMKNPVLNSNPTSSVKEGRHETIGRRSTPRCSALPLTATDAVTGWQAANSLFGEPPHVNSIVLVVENSPAGLDEPVQAIRNP